MSLQEEAARTVEAIARRFADIESTVEAWHAQPAATVRTGLGDGYPGMALLFAELAHQDPRHLRTAHAWLAQAARCQPVPPPHAGLYHGIPALCFVTHCTAGGTDRYSATLEHLDERVAVLVRASVDEERRRLADRRRVTISAYDVISGLAGLGALSLARRLDGTTRSVLDALVALTRPLPDGETPLPGWWVAQDTVSYAPASVHDGHANLGCAHGMAGPLALLSLAWSDGIRVPGQRDAARVLVQWLCEQRLADAPGWPTVMTTKGAVTGLGRPSWCYGAPGIARALYLAGTAFGEPRWRHEAVTTLLAVLTAKPGGSLLTDPGLCHGWAGLLHITRLMTTESGVGELAEFLPTMTRHLLDLVHEGAYPLSAREQTPDGAREDAFGLLSGMAGAALALHAYSTGAAPRSGWDRALLVA
ncbi:lanthionine synthetase C family protein [Streptomyces seoulensis]